MNHKLEQKIYNSAPILYQQKELDMQQSCMCWGLECPDDWYDLLYKLSQELEAINRKNSSLGIQIQACQVKEKWYSLRFYYDIVLPTPKSRHSTINWITTFVNWIKLLCKYKCQYITYRKYSHSLWETVNTLIDEAEAESSRIYKESE